MTEQQALDFATDLWTRAETLRVDLWNIFGDPGPHEVADELQRRLKTILEFYKTQVPEPTPHVPPPPALPPFVLPMEPVP